MTVSCDYLSRQHRCRDCCQFGLTNPTAAHLGNVQLIGEGRRAGVADGIAARAHLDLWPINGRSPSTHRKGSVPHPWPRRRGIVVSTCPTSMATDARALRHAGQATGWCPVQRTVQRWGIKRHDGPFSD